MKELYRKFDRLMKSCTLVSIIALVGCAQSVPKPEATHEWTAGHKKLALTFRQNNSDCSESATSVNYYEACMQERGYKLISQR
jgi:hypothetical protein